MKNKPIHGFLFKALLVLIALYVLAALFNGADVGTAQASAQQTLTNAINKTGAITL